MTPVTVTGPLREKIGSNAGLSKAPAPTPEQARAVMLAAASHARGPRDLADLLHVLGLDPR